MSDERRVVVSYLRGQVIVATDDDGDMDLTELTPDEARKIARLLSVAADMAEGERRLTPAAIEDIANRHRQRAARKAANR